MRVARNHNPRTCIKLSATRSLICISTLASRPLLPAEQLGWISQTHPEHSSLYGPPTPLTPTLDAHTLRTWSPSGYPFSAPPAVSRSSHDVSMKLRVTKAVLFETKNVICRNLISNLIAKNRDESKWQFTESKEYRRSPTSFLFPWIYGHGNVTWNLASIRSSGGRALDSRNKRWILLTSLTAVNSQQRAANRRSDGSRIYPELNYAGWRMLFLTLDFWMLMFLTCPRLNVVQTFVYKVVAGGKKAKKKYRPFYGEKNDARDNDTEMLRYVPSLPEIKCHVKHFATHVPYFALISIYRAV